MKEVEKKNKQKIYVVICQEQQITTIKSKYSWMGEVSLDKTIQNNETFKK